MEIETLLPLSHLEVYVMRDFEAEKKLVVKDPNSYGVGATRIPKVDVKVDGAYSSLKVNSGARFLKTDVCLSLRERTWIHN